MTYLLPNDVFSLILKYCDDRLEKKQRFYHNKSIQTIKKIKTYSRIRNIRKCIKETELEIIKEIAEKKLYIQKKIEILQVLWQFRYLRQINCSTSQSMYILLDRLNKNKKLNGLSNLKI